MQEEIDRSKSITPCFFLYKSDQDEIPTNVTHVVFSQSIKEIPSRKFYQFQFLHTVDFPTGLEDIGPYAFFQCKSLKHIKCPFSLRSIGPCAFSYCHNLASVELSEGLESIGNAAFLDCTSLKRIHLPSTLRHIGSCAFQNVQLEDVDLPGEIELLGSNSFLVDTEATTFHL